MNPNKLFSFDEFSISKKELRIEQLLLDLSFPSMKRYRSSKLINKNIFLVFAEKLYNFQHLFFIIMNF